MRVDRPISEHLVWSPGQRHGAAARRTVEIVVRRERLAARTLGPPQKGDAACLTLLMAHVLGDDGPGETPARLSLPDA